MHAMILAAGRGERLRPLTDQIPKPLVEVAGKPLIEHHIENLSAAGFKDFVINQGHLGEMLPRALGDGERWDVRIHWSDELDGALETGGGIFHALPLLGDSPFLIINGDVWTDYPFSRLKYLPCDLAHLVMIPNPPHHPNGDFALDNGKIFKQGQSLLTFSGVSVYHPRFFESCSEGKFSVVPLLRTAIEQQMVTGELFAGHWGDIGTLERLMSVRKIANFNG
jgi:MurNAc alpha-1-phosphate uridylyltransferase